MLTAKEIADKADIIIRGYAITKVELGYSVINLHKENSATVFSKELEMLETCMDDIELEISKKILIKALTYLEEAVA